MSRWKKTKKECNRFWVWRVGQIDSQDKITVKKILRAIFLLNCFLT